MTPTILIAALAVGQLGCSGGSCSVASPGFGFMSRSAFMTPLTAPASFRPAPYTAPVAPATYVYPPPTYSYPGERLTPAPQQYIQPNQPAIVSTPAPPQQYSMSDGHGWTWSHSNREYLKAWVAGRKSALDDRESRVVIRTSDAPPPVPATAMVGQ